MLIQRRDDGGLRLIAQHDHGLLSGELAAAWREPEGGDELRPELVLASALHDLAWRELDEEPRWNPETREPHDFLDFPPEDKYRAASEAIDRIEDLHPYAAVLVSLHYSTFGSPGRPPDFEESEEERRLELLDDLDDDAPGSDRIRRDLDFLRLFDNLSLFLCLATPGARAGSLPPWLSQDLFRVPGREHRLELRWDDETHVTVEPFCFGGEELRADAGLGDSAGPGDGAGLGGGGGLEDRGAAGGRDDLELELPYRDLPGGPFESSDALADAWSEADERTMRLRLRAP